MTISKAARAMAYLDDSLISAAVEEAPPAKKRVKAGWLVAAACLCLALSGTALAGALKLVHIQDLGDGVHYDVRAQMAQLPVADFTGPMMRELPEIFVRRYAEDAMYVPDPQDPFSAAYRPSPSMVFLDFAGVGEAADYIGLDALTVPDWDFIPKNVRLTAEGMENGDIYALSLEVNYRSKGVDLVSRAELYTEHFDLAAVDISWGVSYGGSDKGERSFTQSAYTTPNGTACDILTLNDPAAGMLYTDCYLVHNGIFYRLHLVYGEDQADYAGTLLRQWADMFP